MMRKHNGRATALAIAICLSTTAVAAPPITAYGQLPGISSVEISPDGTKFAAIIGNETRAEIQLRNLGDNKLIAATPTERAKVRSLQWAGPDHLLATTSTTAAVAGLDGPRREWFSVHDYNLTTSKWKGLLNNVEGAMNVISGSPTALVLEGKPVLIVPGISFPGSTGTSTLYKVMLDSGRAVQQEIGNTNTSDWVIGPDGKAVARADYTERGGEWRLFLRPQSSWERGYTEVAPVDAPSLISLGRDSGTVLVSTRKTGEYQVHEVAVADGSWSPPKPELDGDSMITDPATHTLIGTVDYGFEGISYNFLSEADQKLWRSLSKAFPGEIVSLASWSNDRMTAIVEVDGPINGDAFFVVDRKAKTAKWLADRYPGVTAADVGLVKPFTYKAADGMEIPAYLTLPPGVKVAKGLPLIVLAHGGPASRDYPGFDWWAQAIASRGYAVLQPQFRGSAGFGAAHRDAGFGEWGRKMQTDLSDGVRVLVADGSVDPKRVCIAGASYGGYAALAGATIDPGPYRCAASVAGVSDLRRMLNAEVSDAGGSRNSTLRYWKRFMGAASESDPKLDAISPLRLATRAKMPVLLIHGKDDTVVPYDQSTTMEKALKAAGANVEMVTLASEDHWLSRSTTRIQMLTAMVGFLEKHNPPAAPVAVAAASN
ncbi:MAG: alpha/beta hydrolase family protein [Polymorphobacter sp.]